MTSFAFLWVCCLSSFASANASEATPTGSDPIAVYALIDRAEHDPKAGTLIAHGAFLVGKGVMGGESHAARWGTMHLRGSREHATEHAKLFGEMAAVAGTGKVFSFGTRRDATAYTVGTAESPQWVDLQGRILAHDLGVAQEYEPVVSLRSLPRNLEVTFDAQTIYTGARKIEFSAVAGVHRSTSLRYVFEFEFASGERIASKPLREDADGKIHWIRYFTLGSEEAVRVSVRAHDDLLDQSSVISHSLRAPKIEDAADGDGR